MCCAEACVDEIHCISSLYIEWLSTASLIFPHFVPFSVSLSLSEAFSQCCRDTALWTYRHSRANVALTHFTPHTYCRLLQKISLYTNTHVGGQSESVAHIRPLTNTWTHRDVEPWRLDVFRRWFVTHRWFMMRPCKLLFNVMSIRMRGEK